MENVTEKTAPPDVPHWTVTTTTPEPHHSAEEEHPGQKGPGRGYAPIFALIAVVLLGLAIFFGIRSRSSAERQLQKATDSAAVPTVNVIHPTVGAAAQEVVFPGNTQAFIDTSIYARTSGYLNKWFADIGTQVHQGQLLAIIESPEVDQQLQQAEADLKTAQANQQLAASTNTRWQDLVAKHAVSVQEADQTASDLVAKQTVTAAAEANVRRLQQLQSYERVVAPFDGVITARDTDVGSLIDAGSSAQPHELFHLDQIGQLRIFVAVPEAYAANIHNGEQVDVTQDSDPTEVIHGTVTRNADSISETSRTLNVEVDVNNSAHRLLPGAYVFVHMKLPQGSGAVTIPSNTLIFRTQGLQVGVVRNGHAQLVPITIGHDFGSSVEVTSGINPQDEVILDPSDSLVSGTPVEIGTVTGSTPAQ